MATWNAEKQQWEWTNPEIDAEIEAGRARTSKRREQRPRASIVSACYMAIERRVRVDLNNGTTFIFPVDHVQGLAQATDDQLGELKVLSDDILAWDGLDAIAPVSDLMAGTFGSKDWMRRLSELGRRGGASRSAAKIAAARENGRHGGRPKKAAT